MSSYESPKFSRAIVIGDKNYLRAWEFNISIGEKDIILTMLEYSSQSHRLIADPNWPLIGAAKASIAEEIRRRE